MLKKITHLFKWIFRIFFGLFAIYIIYLNCALYYQPTFEQEGHCSYNQSVYHQLQFLKRRIYGEAGDLSMQKLYPEGEHFMHLLYGLSWADWAQSAPCKRSEALAEISRSQAALARPATIEQFPEDLPLPRGAYYTGWTSYLLGRKIQLQEQPDSLEVQQFQANCKAIRQALAQAPHPFLESYHDHAWPADVVTCIASLALHDRLFEPIYQQVITDWVSNVKKSLDPDTGLTPHSVNAHTGEPSEIPQGASQSLFLVFLQDIDADFAQEQFELFKKYLLAYRLGLPGIRAYPAGMVSQPHVDAGPIVWGIGASSSIVGQRVMGQYSDSSHYHGLRNCIHAFGMAYSWNGEKKYLFGQHIMADAFMCWANAIEQQPINSKSNWRWSFQVSSGLFILLIGFLSKITTKRIVNNDK